MTKIFGNTTINFTFASSSQINLNLQNVLNDKIVKLSNQDIRAIDRMTISFLSVMNSFNHAEELEALKENVFKTQLSFSLHVYSVRLGMF